MASSGRDRGVYSYFTLKLSVNQFLPNQLRFELPKWESTFGAVKKESPPAISQRGRGGVCWNRHASGFRLIVALNHYSPALFL
jgi:hypothetical protein